MRVRSGAVLWTAVLLVGAAASVRAQPVDRFEFTAAPPTGVPYSVETEMVFRVAAFDAGGATVTGFNDPVTIGLYEASDLVPTNLSDGQARIGPCPVGGGGSAGTAVMNFTNGVLDFCVSPRTAASLEKVWVQHATVPGLSHPAHGDTGVGYQVTGYFTALYLRDADDANPPASYPPDVDALTSTPLTGSEVVVDLPYSADGSQPAVFVLSGFSGGFADCDLNAAVVPHLWVRSATTEPSEVRYRVIADYDGSRAPSEYLDPVTPATDGEWLLSSPQTVSSGFSLLPYATFNILDSRYPVAMENGRVILAVWRTNVAVGAQMRLQSGLPEEGSYLGIGFSPLNTQDVTGEITPSRALTAAGPVTFTLAVRNNSAKSIQRFTLRLPGNPSAGPANWYWDASGLACDCTVDGVLDQPSGTVDGAVGLLWNGGGIAPHTSATVSMVMNVSGAIRDGWNFDFQSVLDPSYDSIPFKTGVLRVDTLGRPDDPAGATAVTVQGGGQVDVTWDPVTVQLAYGYYIDRSVDGSAYTRAATLDGAGVLSWRDPSAPNLSSVQYRVHARNPVAISLPGTETAPVTPYADPAPLQSFAARSHGGGVSLTWSDPPTPMPGSYPATVYEVYRGPSPAGVTLYASTTEKGYDDLAASSGVTTYYVARAVDSQHTGVMGPGTHESPPTAASPGFPPGYPPTGLTASASGLTVRLDWAAPVSGSNLEDPSAYILYRRLNAAPTTLLYDSRVTLGGAAVTYDDTSGITYGGGYYYLLTAVLSGPSETNAAGPVSATIAPEAPSNLSAAVTAGNIRVAWDPLDASQNVSDYRVEYVNLSTGVPLTVSAGVTAVWTHGTPTRGADFRYRVSAQNAGGWGAWSSSVTMSLPPMAPLPGALSALSGPTGDVDLSWSVSSTDANVDRYNLYRGSSPTFAAATLFGPSLGPDTTHNDPARAPGELLYYFLQYINIGGTSPASSPVSLIVPPEAPATLTASSVAGAVTIDWAPVTAQGVTRYYVYADSTNPNPRSLGPSARVTTVPTPGTGWQETLAPGTLRYYQVTAANGDSALPGGEGPPSNAATQLSPPGVPTGLSVTFTGTAKDQAQVSWVSPGGTVAVYHVYRDGAPAVTVTAPTVTWLDTFPMGQHGTTFVYAVDADNSGGGMGGTSARAAVTVVVPPAAPAGLTALPNGAAITLNWGAVTGATSYWVYASSTDPNPQSLGPSARVTSVPTPVTGWQETASAGTLRYYQVTAVGAGGEGAPSTTASQRFPPDPPGGLSVTFNGTGSDEALLSWVPPLGQTVERYLVSYNGSAAVTVSSPATVYADPGTAGNYGGGVTYSIRSDNESGGLGGAGASAAVTTRVPPRPITLVSAGTAMSSDTAVTLVWGAEPAQGVTGYYVERQVDGGAFFRALTVTGAASFSATVLGNTMRGHPYGFRVRAVNQGGAGAGANTLTVTVPPSAVTVLSGTSGFAGASAAVSIAWASAPPVEPVTAYRVYRSTTLSPLGSYAGVATVGAATWTLSDTPPSEPATYFYLVKSVAGGVEGRTTTANAVAVYAFRPPTAPSAPTVDIADSAVTLVWSSAAVTTSHPVTSWICHRSTLPGVLGSATTVTGFVSGAPVTLPVTGLVNGTTYYFRVRARDSLGNLGPLGPEVSGMPVRPPGTPTLTAIDSSLFELELHWTAGTAGTLPVSYVVYRASPAGAPFAAVTMLPGTFLTYNDNDQESGLTSGTTFVYRVQAVDSSGMTLSPQHASGLSNPLTAVTGTVLVNPPRNVAAFAASNAVTVTWSPAYDPTVVIVQTLVYRATDGVSFSLAASYPAATLVYVEPAPSNGVTYTYYLQSVTAAPVTSSASATVTARPAAPPGVPLLSGTDGDSSVTLVLGVPTPTFGGLPVSTLVLSRNPGVPVTFLALSSPITHLETGLANGSGYVYQAQAFDVNGVPGSASSPVTGFPYVLGVPVSLSASVTVNGALTYIRVGYEAPVVNSFPVTGYQYFTSQTPGVYGPPNGTGNSISRAVTGVGYPGVTNYFVVRAVDEKNHVSAASEEVSERITLPPQAPATLRAVAGDGQVLLDWPDAAPGTLPVSFYVVTRNGAAAATVTADRSWWLDLGTTDGSPQTYVVTAYDAFFRPDPDAHESAPTVAAVAASADGTPNPVAGLEAGAIDDSRILLEWPRPNDLGGVVTAYAVLRSTGSMPAVYPVTVARVPDTLALETLSFTDSGLDPGTTYHYVLVAEYATGDSGYSNEAQATTLPRLRNVPTVRGTGQALLDRNVVRPMRGDRLGIYFRLAEPADVEIHVYNVAGELMAEVHYGPAPAGDLRSVDWDVKDRLGSWVASGLYLVEVTAGPMHQVLKVAVIR